MVEWESSVCFVGGLYLLNLYQFMNNYVLILLLMDIFHLSSVVYVFD